MRQTRIISIALAALNIILIAVCAVCYFRVDREAPRIRFTAEEIVYREGMSQEKLLEGVTATDNKDGDVTDRIVIEKIQTDTEKNTAVVYFAVNDKAGNVARASREFPAVLSETTGEEEEMRQFTEAGIEADLQQEKEGEPEEQAEEEAENPFPSPDPSLSPSVSPDPDSSASPSPEATPSESPGAEAAPSETPAETQTPASQPTEGQANNTAGTAPVLTLGTTQIETKAGTTPAWVNVIATLTDDKDSYETLFHNLTISDYDKDTPGTYQVSVSTVDSDGNSSGTSQLTIVVR